MYQYFEQPDFPEHVRLTRGPHHFKCGFQNCTFTGLIYLNYFVHVSEEHYCRRCSIYRSRIQSHDCPRINQQGGGEAGPAPFFELISKTHGSALMEYQHVFESISSDMAKVFNDVEIPQLSLFESLVESKDARVVKIVLTCVLSREVDYADGFKFRRYARILFPSLPVDLFSTSDSRDVLIDSAAQIMTDVRAFLMNASGWVLENCESMQMQCSTLKLFQNAKVGSYIKFPLTGKRGFYNFNVKKDCIKWSIIAGVFHLKEKVINVQRPKGERKQLKYYTSWKEYEDKLEPGMFNSHGDLYGSLAECESRNSININVFSHKGESVIIVRKSRTKFHPTVNLFLIHNANDQKLASKQHMNVLYDVNRFLARTTTTKSKAQYCQLCFRRLTSQLSGSY